MLRSRLARVTRLIRGGLSWVVGLPHRIAIGVYRLVKDRGTRPALLYSLALAFGLGSFLVYLVGDAGSPSRLELGMQFASVGVLFYLSMMNAGEAAPRHDRPD